MNKVNFRRLVLCAVMTAIILILTLLVKIPAPLGYVHIGDAAICLAAVFLPTPYALAAAALGGALSDLLGGFPLYAGFTAVIKASMVLAFTWRSNRFLVKRNVLAALLAAVITPVGYLATDAAILALTGGGSLLTWEPWSAALAAAPFNAMQGAVSLVLFYAAALLLDRLGFKARLTSRIGG